MNAPQRLIPNDIYGLPLGIIEPWYTDGKEVSFKLTKFFHRLSMNPRW